MGPEWVLDLLLTIGMAIFLCILEHWVLGG